MSVKNLGIRPYGWKGRVTDDDSSVEILFATEKEMEEYEDDGDDGMKQFSPL